MKKSERHHYIPKFYINGFLDDENKLYVYDKEKDEVKKKNHLRKGFFMSGIVIQQIKKRIIAVT